MRGLGFRTRIAHDVGPTVPRRSPRFSRVLHVVQRDLLAQYPLRLLILALPLVVLTAGQTGCQTKAKDAAPAAKAVSPAKVEKMPGEADLTTITLTPEAEVRLELKTATVEARSVARTRVVGGEVVVPPGHTLIVSSPIAGTLFAPPGGVPVAGTKVQKGQVLFNLVPLLSAEARATFATTRVEAQGQVEQGAKQVDQAKLVLERAERLRQQNLGGSGAIEDARAAFEVAQATYKAATTRRDAIDQAIKGAEGGALESVAIAAEGGGIIRNIHVAPGQKVAPGTILFEVVNLNTVNVRAAVYVGDLTKIDETQPAGVGDLTGGPTAKTVVAKRVVAPPSGDPIAATVDLFYRVENADGALRPGQRIGVSLPLKATKAGLTVPRAALLRDIDGGTWVYESLDKHKYARRRVRVDNVVGDVASLSAGPKAGTKVVTDGAAELFGVEFGGSK